MVISILSFQPIADSVIADRVCAYNKHGISYRSILSAVTSIDTGNKIGNFYATVLVFLIQYEGIILHYTTKLLIGQEVVISIMHKSARRALININMFIIRIFNR